MKKHETPAPDNEGRTGDLDGLLPFILLKDILTRVWAISGG